MDHLLQRIDAQTALGRARNQGHELAGCDRSVQGRLDHGSRHVSIELHKGLHHLVVNRGKGLHLLAPQLLGPLQVLAPRDLTVVLLDQRAVAGCADRALQNVEEARACLLARKVRGCEEHHGPDAEALLERIHRALEGCHVVNLVYPIDEDHGRLGRAFQRGEGTAAGGVHTLGRRNDRNGTMGHVQCPLDNGCSIHMARRVNQVQPRGLRRGVASGLRVDVAVAREIPSVLGRLPL
mmetsp:Transcript_144316/g.462268  ORF Transcript_144316/g.462268 Transcript_144316/m.462268 type:complete len:237 (+) Transcript_144316:1726-2436(+)